jgi:hypothetical protein
MGKNKKPMKRKISVKKKIVDRGSKKKMILVGLVVLILLVVGLIIGQVIKDKNSRISSEVSNTIQPIITQGEGSPGKDAQLPYIPASNPTKADSFQLPASVNPGIVSVLKKNYSALKENKDKLTSNEEIKTSMQGAVSWNVSTENIKIADYSSPTLGINLSPEDNDFSYKVIPIVEKIFVNDGFKKDLSESVNYPNTGQGIYGDAPVSRYIYDKNDIRCEMDFTQDIGMSISCSDKYLENYQAQAKILKDLGVSQDTLNLGLSKIIGRYAFFELGHNEIVAEMDANNKWTILFDGLDTPPCKLITDNKVPKEIISDCYPEGENTNTIPNPVN